MQAAVERYLAAEVPPSRLRLRRLALGVKLWQMSRVIGHSVSHLSTIERGYVRRPVVEAKMRAFLDVQGARQKAIR